MTLPVALEQLAKLADFLDREIKGCGHDNEFVIAPMFGVQAMRDTLTALSVVVTALTDGNQSTTQSSGDNRGSAAPESSSQSEGAARPQGEPADEAVTGGEARLREALTTATANFETFFQKWAEAEGHAAAVEANLRTMIKENEKLLAQSAAAVREALTAVAVEARRDADNYEDEAYAALRQLANWIDHRLASPRPVTGE